MCSSDYKVFLNFIKTKMIHYSVCDDGSFNKECNILW